MHCGLGLAIGYTGWFRFEGLCSLLPVGHRLEFIGMQPLQRQISSLPCGLCILCRGNRHLQPLLGVAWDCGAVTTGPVTVPVLLSLGVGVMSAQKEKRLALAVLEDAAVNKSEGGSHTLQAR